MFELSLVRVPRVGSCDPLLADQTSLHRRLRLGCPSCRAEASSVHLPMNSEGFTRWHCSDQQPIFELILRLVVEGDLFLRSPFLRRSESDQEGHPGRTRQARHPKAELLDRPGGLPEKECLRTCNPAILKAEAIPLAGGTTLRLEEGSMKRTLIAAAFVLLTPLSLRAQPTEFNEKTVAQLQAQMAAGTLTSVQLTQFYIDRILALDQNGPNVNSVIELNPDALVMAQNADALRAKGKVLGQLHGIPVLLKDNIDTGDKMQTTAGSFALLGKSAVHDSTVAANLRAAGAVLLGKTNLSEWANFRSFYSSSGWSGRGGLTANPYSLDRNGCGSSTGSAVAVAANFAAVSIGTETDGSIVCPANVNGVVGIKPTVGLTSRAGVVPISHTQDTVGPHARTVADAAAVLNSIISRTPDPGDPATAGVPLGWQGTGRTRPALPADYTAFVDPAGLRGARVGVTRQGIDNAPPQVIDAFDKAVAAIQNAGATVVDHNAGVNGIDAALSQFNLDAVVAPTDSPGWTTDLILSDHFLFASSGLAGGPGYPIVQVPAANVLGMPMGISFLGTAFSEPTLIKLASGFEAVTHARFQPTFTGNATMPNTSGTTLTPPPPPKKDTGKRPHHM